MLQMSYAYFKSKGKKLSQAMRNFCTHVRLLARNQKEIQNWNEMKNKIFFFHFGPTSGNVKLYGFYTNIRTTNLSKMFEINNNSVKLIAIWFK